MGIQTEDRQVVSPDHGHMCELHTLYTTKIKLQFDRLEIPLYCDFQARLANHPHNNGCGSLWNRLDAPDLQVQNEAQQRGFKNTAMILKVHKLCMTHRADKEL